MANKNKCWCCEGHGCLPASSPQWGDYEVDCDVCDGTGRCDDPDPRDFLRLDTEEQAAQAQIEAEWAAQDDPLEADVETFASERTQPDFDVPDLPF